jgi:hypothetical protein
MNKVISQYKNGNYTVTIFDDGTKVRYNKEDSLVPDFAESMDMKISNYCPYGCKMCHERSSINGAHAQILNNKFVDSLHEGTELAIGGGAVTFHPDLVPFLENLREKNIIPSITINQKEFETNRELILKLINEKLIFGLGVSFVDFNDELWTELLQYSNVVVHLIVGYHPIEVFDYFAAKNAKILILGFKNWGRGEQYLAEYEPIVNNKILQVQKQLDYLINNCKVVSFDNLAIKQLEIKNYLSEEDWNNFYMGNDGQYTMYADLVKMQFARSSTSPTRYDIENYNYSSLDAFNVIRNED